MKHVRLHQNAKLQVNNKYTLDEYGSHHLTKVLRFPQGQNITIFNGDGMDYLATVLQIKKHCEVEIYDCVKNNSESDLNITLAQGIAKGEKMDFLMQKAVELGVNKIVPIMSERCVVKLKGGKLKKRHQHWCKIVVGACEQSGRSIVPVVENPVTFNEFIDRGVNNGFVLHHRAQKSLLEMDKTTETTVLIGPEGGLTDNEINLAMDSGYKALLLGARVLRTETASLAVIANMQLLWGS